MADGRTHATLTYATALLVGAGSAGVVSSASLPPAQTTALVGTAIAGCLFGLIVYPDLDISPLEGKTVYGIQIATRMIGFLWVLMWLPYGILIPHRSPLSHLPVLGTAIRLVYFGVFVFLISSIWGGHWWLYDYLFIIYKTYTIVFIIALMIADFVHFFADILISSERRYRHE